MTTTPSLWRSEFRLNATLAGNQSDAVVATTNDNQFFAVWVDSTNFNGGLPTIVARKFDSLGNPLDQNPPIDVVLGDGLNVGGFTLTQPAAVGLPDGGLAVTFNVGPGTIWVQTTNSTLATLNPPIPIDLSGLDSNPSITSVSGNGSLIVAYTIQTSAT